MRAVVQEKYGSIDDLKLQEVARPAPAEDEVLVRVRAASLHPDVWHVVTGRPWVLRLMGGGFLRPKNPIPGTDMAGIVEKVGGAVTRFRPGDEVFGETSTHQWMSGGAFAEYVAVREDLLAPKPWNVGYEEAAAVPTSGFIALVNFREWSRLGPGQRVLVNGAGGGVGTICLQLAVSRGCRVTAVDGPAKLELLRALGADEVLDYTREDFTRRGARWDFIVDIPGNRPFREIRRALEPDGRYVPIGHEGYGAVGKRVFGLIPHFLRLMFLSRVLKRRQLRGPANLPAPTRREAVAVLRELLEAGTLTPVIDRTYPLGEVREALRHMVRKQTPGKVILTP